MSLLDVDRGEHRAHLLVEICLSSWTIYVLNLYAHCIAWHWISIDIQRDYSGVGVSFTGYVQSSPVPSMS